MSHVEKTVARAGSGALIVAAAAMLVYANSLFNGFAFDDEFIILNNARVHQLSDLGAIFLTPYWPGFGAEAGLYRPLAIFGYAVQWSLGGGSPLVFHALNVLLHALTSVLGYVVLRRFVPALPALLGALVFAVHPVHTEAVANAVGQAELLAGAAMLGACALHFRDRERHGKAHALALSALFACALLAKESALMLPALLIAGDAALGRWTVRRQDLGRQDLGRYARAMSVTIVILAMVAAAYIALRVAVLGSFTGGDAAPSLPFLRTGQRFFVALQTWPEYLRLLVFPLDLSADYSPDVIVPAAGWTPSVIFGFLLLVATVVFALRLLLPSDGSRPGALRLLLPSDGSRPGALRLLLPSDGSRPGALRLLLPSDGSRPGALRLLLPSDGSRPGSFAAAWFLVAVVPVSNLLVPIGVVLAERTLYVPSFAIAILTAAVAARIVAAASDAQPGAGHVATRAAVAAAIVLLLLGVRTVTRNPDWRDTPAYWNALVRDHPESYRAQWGAAAHMIANGEPEQGLRYMESAAETWNDDPHLLAQLGGLYIERGQPARALEVLQRAWSLGHEDGPMPLYLGMAAIGTGQFDNAMAWAGLARSSENQAERAAAEALRAQALDGLGRPGEAASAWMAAIEASPGRSFTYWMMLARAHGRAGHAARATAAADTARLLAPDEEAVLRVDRLKAVIATDCWKDSGRANGPDRCADPLEDWILVTPSRAITIEQRSSSP